MKREIKNVGTISLENITLDSSSIALFIPLETMNDDVQEKINELESMYIKAFEEKYPNIDTSSFTLNRDISLNIGLDSQAFVDKTDKHIYYAYSVIIWYKECTDTEYEFVEFYDPIDVELDKEDKQIIKQIIIDQLSELFFK